MKMHSLYTIMGLSLLTLTMCVGKKVLFIDLLNGINISYNKKKSINKYLSNNYEYFPNKSPFANKSTTQELIKTKTYITLDDKTKENILKQYIYTLSHLSIFDIDRDKDIPMNLSFLIKACMASHNYIKNVEIYTSAVNNKELCSFIYEDKIEFDNFFKLHMQKYIDFFNNPNIDETLKSYIDDKELYNQELIIFNKINKDTSLQKNVLLDILFECSRLNKLIQYSLALNKFDLLHSHIMYKIFLYFKTSNIYYDIYIHNIKKVKYYYAKKNIKDEHKEKIFKIVNLYLNILKQMNETYEKTYQS
ncbi:liver merozoite formation protein, putative [Hepatocystis sp. ex Piliocolobus tephrosceles]|nr:liver merozoite formation protein, putative [Hepatocystis sp. ex Piliocolobus tephrosceles]